MGSIFRSIFILRDLSQWEKLSDEGWKRSDTTYPSPVAEPVPCRFFLPDKQIHDTLIIFPGASPFGEDHPALNVLGAALARRGIQVVVPRIPLLMDLNLTPDIIPSMCHFYSWFMKEKRSERHPVRVAGVSYGGAMVLKCLLEKPFQENPPAAVLVYGTHFDLRQALEHYFAPEPREITSEWPLTVFFHNFLKKIDAGYDTTSLQNVLAIRVRDEEVDDMLLPLSRKERELGQALIRGEISPEIRRLTPMILDQCQDELTFFSPSNWAGVIQTPIQILHGSQDTMVHWTQSKKLARHLPHARLLITRLFEHHEMVTLGRRWAQVKETVKLVRFIAGFLS